MCRRFRESPIIQWQPMNRFRVIALGIVLAVASSTSGGCQRRFASPHAPLPPSRPEAHITIENYPNGDGSTSTQPLRMLMPCGISDAPKLWNHSEVDDSRQLQATYFYEKLGVKWCQFDSNRTDTSSRQCYRRLFKRARTELLWVTSVSWEDGRSLCPGFALLSTPNY